MPDDEIEVTELLEIDPSRVDAVGSPANGTSWLMLKAIDGQVVESEIAPEDVLSTITKADDDTDDKECPTCDGSGKIMEGNRKCPKCLGTGTAPKVGQTEKELRATAKATAPSGVATPPAKDCPTCKGSGSIADGTADGKICPDCNGSGKDGTLPPMDKLNAQPGFAGSSDDGNGRLAIDKALADYDTIMKAKYKQADRDKMASGGQAMPDGAYPVADSEDLDNAIHAVGRGGADHDAIRRHIIARAKALNLSSKIPDNWGADGSLTAKSVDVITKDGVTSGANPFIAGTTSTLLPDAPDDDNADAPGSPAWEAEDAQIASDAANLILQAHELTRQFMSREAIEMAAGEGNDIFDTFEASCVLDLLSAAIGQMATLAFHEAVASQAEKALDDTAEKSGARLSGDSISALVAARTVISALLGVDDPESDSDDDDDGDDDSDSDSDDDDDDDETTKAILAKEIDDMTGDELLKVLDGRDEKLVQFIGEALKGKAAMDETAAVSNAKTVNAQGKKKKDKVADTDDTLEDEADQGDHESASGVTQTTGAKSVADDDTKLTPEQIEAKEARKAAKKELRKAEEVERVAAENAALTKKIEEHLAKVVAQNESLNATVETLRSELEGVKKMAAPSGIVKTRTPAMEVLASTRDMIDVNIARYERQAKETTDATLAAGYLDMAKAERDKLATL